MINVVNVENVENVVNMVNLMNWDSKVKVKAKGPHHSQDHLHRCIIADALLLLCKTTKPREICSVPKIDQILEIWKGRIICRW